MLHLRIKEALRQMGITQREFAARATLDEANVSNLLAGRGRAPSYRTLCKILHALPTVDARWLLTGVDSRDALLQVARQQGVATTISGKSGSPEPS